MSSSDNSTRKRGVSPGIAPPIAHATSTSSSGEADGQTSRRLRCLVEGDSIPFVITASADTEIGEFKEIIHEKGKNRALSGVDAWDLVLLKVRNSCNKTQC
jgi:hypothetical protein